MTKSTDFNSFFVPIGDITSNNSLTSKRSSLKNMILGPKIGFSTLPPFDFISKKSWYTQSSQRNSINFFDQFKEPIVIDLKLSDSTEFDAIGFWPSRRSFAHSIREFIIQFSDGKANSTFSNPIYKQATESNPHNLEIFSFPLVKAKVVRITILSNQGKNLRLQGNRVALQEMTIIKDHRLIQTAMQNFTSTACQHDFFKPYISRHISSYEHFVLNIRQEFSLDYFWKPQSTYRDFLTMRGFRYGGGQLRRIDLSKWADKIYVYHFLQEHGIKGMPFINYTYRLNNDFINKVKSLYYDGLQSFVIKLNHLAYGIGIIRVKNGRFISSNEHSGKRDQHIGKAVDFDFINNQIIKYWDDQQFTEEWASLMVPPGVILEELIEEPVELKFTVVFGEVVGFFIENPELPAFDGKGKPLKDEAHKPPTWWQEAKIKAIEVANLVRADHIRIDTFYHKNEVIICEITWCGVEMREYRNTIAEKLNIGYSLRKEQMITHLNRS